MVNVCHTTSVGLSFVGMFVVLMISVVVDYTLNYGVVQYDSYGKNTEQSKIRSIPIVYFVWYRPLSLSHEPSSSLSWCWIAVTCQKSNRSGHYGCALVRNN